MIQSDPSDAKVIINGKAKGTTPVFFEKLRAGNHLKIEISHKSAITQTINDVTVKCNEHKIMSISLQRKPITLIALTVLFAPQIIYGMKTKHHSTLANKKLISELPSLSSQMKSKLEPSARALSQNKSIYVGGSEILIEPLTLEAIKPQASPQKLILRHSSFFRMKKISICRKRVPVRPITYSAISYWYRFILYRSKLANWSSVRNSTVLDLG